MSKLIPVRDPKNPVSPVYAIVDDEDFDNLNKDRWLLDNNPKNGTFYAVKYRRDRVPGEPVMMHKIITGFKLTDHINRNGLDNRRENLREATHSENNLNTIKRKTYKGKPTSSKYKGVHWDARGNGCWVASATLNGKQRELGRFHDEKEAALSYDLFARMNYGEFALLNYP